MDNLFKAYENEYEKYLGKNTERIKRNFMICIERHDHAYISECDGYLVFVIMLIGNASQYYIEALKSKILTLGELESTVKIHSWPQSAQEHCFIIANPCL